MESMLESYSQTLIADKVKCYGLLRDHRNNT